MRKEKKQFFCKNKFYNYFELLSNGRGGITLIALVITIIVMLILAGVSLNATVGENGILSQAQNAKLTQEDAAWYENAQMILTDALIGKDGIDDMKEYLRQKFIEYDGEAVYITLTSDGGYLIVSGTRAIKVNGNLEVLESSTTANANFLIATGEQWLFTVSNGTAILQACNIGIVGELKIPKVVVDKETQEVYEVTGLGDNIFNYATKLTKVDFSSVSNQLKTIGVRTFMNCSNLEITVPEDLPSTITSIGDKAFYGCTKLAGNITTIQNSGIALGKGVFMKCSGITGNIQDVFDQNFYIENGSPVATEILDNEFSGYSGLTGTLTIPNYITQIGNNAFYGCTGIQGLVFQEGSQCTSIGSYAFYQCSSMSNSVILPNSITNISSYAFSQSGIRGVTLPNNITSLGAYAFSEATALGGTLNIPASLSTINSYCFYKNAITTINFQTSANKGIVTIGNNAFYQCYSLTTINTTESTSLSFPNTLTTIGTSAFYSDSNLGDVYFPDSLTTIGGSAFRYCNKVNVKRWSTGLKTIGSLTFYSTTCLTTLPDKTSLVTIGESAFYNSSNLGKVGTSSKTNIIEWLQNSKITSIGNTSFSGDTYLNGEFTGTVKNNTNANIAIGIGAFGASGVTRSGTITNGATSIAAGQFNSATSITNVTVEGTTKVLRIPSTVTSIEDNAFSGSTAFNKLIIPNTVTNIGQNAFYRCTALKEVVFESESTITNIKSGTFSYCNSLSKIQFPDKLTTISASSFNQTSALQTIVFPNSLKTIGDGAFSWAGAKYVTFNDGLTTIGNYVFSGDHVINIVIPDSVTSIGTSAFARCSSLTTIVFGEGITTLPNTICGYPSTGDGNANYGSLTTVTVRGEITSIGTDSFRNQNKLTKIEGLDWSKLKSIGSKAFNNCSLFTGEAVLNPSCSLYDDTFENSPFLVSKE